MGFDFLFNREDLKAGVLVSLLSVWVLVGVFYYLNRYTQRRYFAIWTVAWLFYALWLTIVLALRDGIGRPMLPLIEHSCLCIAATFLLWGSFKFLGRRVPQRLLALFIGFLIAWSYVTTLFEADRRLLEGPVFALVGLSSMFTGWGFRVYRQRRAFLGAGLLAGGFPIWGVYLVAYPFTMNSANLFSAGFFIAAVIQLFIAISMIVLVLEQVRFYHQRRSDFELRQKREETSFLKRQVLSSEDRYRRLFQHAKEPIIITAKDDFRILELNDAAEELLGVNSAEAHQHTLLSFCQPDVSNNALQDGAAGFQFICGQRPLRLLRADGTAVACEVEGSTIDAAGTPANQFFLRQLTESSRLQNQLHQAERLSILGQMASSLAHEVQNPITAVTMLLQLALDKTSGEGRTNLELAAKEVLRVGRLTSNFLALTRKREREREWVSLNDLAKGLLDLRRYEFSVARITLQTELDPSLPQVEVNSDQILELILNLLSNSIQAIQGEQRPGTIRVKTALAFPHVQLTVEDDGPGVPEANLLRIFEPYFTTKPPKIGTGLGLSISHRIALEHQGRLSCQRSTLGGAAFILELPIQISQRFPVGPATDRPSVESQTAP